MSVLSERFSFSAALIALTATLPSTALASEGWYGRIGAALATGGEADIASIAPLGGDASIEDSVLAEAAIGHAWSNGWRAELATVRWEGDLEAGPLLDPGGTCRR